MSIHDRNYIKTRTIERSSKVLVDYEPKNEDPILASQYLSAVVGSIVATAEIPKKDKDDILKQLIEFTQYVYDQQSDALTKDSETISKNTEDAYGVWKPE